MQVTPKIPTSNTKIDSFINSITLNKLMVPVQESNTRIFKLFKEIEAKILIIIEKENLIKNKKLINYLNKAINEIYNLLNSGIDDEVLEGVNRISAMLKHLINKFDLSKEIKIKFIELFNKYKPTLVKLNKYLPR